MNWLKAKRLIRRKPYLLDPYRCRSAEEAQKILDEEGVLSPDALLSAARVRAGMSEAEWEAYTGISSEEMRRKIERLTPIRIGKVFSLSRRAAVTLIIVVVLALFMACTPIGRALAVAAYNAIVEVVDGILYIRTDEEADISRDELTIESIEDAITYFDSVSDAAEQIDEPILCFQNDAAELDGICMVSNPIDGTYLESRYLLHDGIKVAIEQSWGGKHEENVVANPMQETISVLLDNGIAIDGVYSSSDSVFVGVAVAPYTVIRICVENIHETDTIQELLNDLTMN